MDHFSFGHVDHQIKQTKLVIYLKWRLYKCSIQECSEDYSVIVDYIEMFQNAS